MAIKIQRLAILNSVAINMDVLLSLWSELECARCICKTGRPGSHSRSTIVLAAGFVI